MLEEKEGDVRIDEYSKLTDQGILSQRREFIYFRIMKRKWYLYPNKFRDVIRRVAQSAISAGEEITLTYSTRYIFFSSWKQKKAAFPHFLIVGNEKSNQSRAKKAKRHTPTNPTARRNTAEGWPRRAMDNSSEIEHRGVRSGDTEEQWTQKATNHVPEKATRVTPIVPTSGEAQLGDRGGENRKHRQR